ncbi:hypothetical protein KP509_18G017600 [Ceratopteris richardii]|uniref:Uncharacterized protein n=1 Tax=Ceratopteris richardii TaxID=49495 RepID=A0A8T2SPX7_CERRI|nr:hypothetical protein KP509_18G017600 [Ceratopteris richardii]
MRAGIPRKQEEKQRAPAKEAVARRRWEEVVRRIQERERLQVAALGSLERGILGYLHQLRCDVVERLAQDQRRRSSEAAAIAEIRSSFSLVEIQCNLQEFMDSYRCFLVATSCPSSNAYDSVPHTI